MTDWNKFHAVMVAVSRASKAYHSWLHTDQLIAAISNSDIPINNKLAKIAMYKSLQQSLQETAYQDFRLAMEAHSNVD